jgi:AraC-like DNA-binding protein
MKTTGSKFYKTPLFDGLEALDAANRKVSFPAHFHPTFNITLVYDGVFQSRLKGKDVSALPGNILITNPLEIHANPFENGNTVSFFTFYLSPDFLGHNDGKKAIVFNENVIDDGELFARLHAVSQQIRNGGAGADFEQQFGKTLSLLSAGHGSEGPGEEDDDYPIFEEYLAEEHLKFSLTEAARQFGIDKFKFLRIFKSQTGLSPNNYFNLKRIEKSKQLLAEGADLLAIAIDLGFYDVAHFCNQFKKFTGISPIAYKTGL